MQRLARGGTSGTNVAGGPLSVLRPGNRLSAEAVGAVTVERTEPTLVLHHLPGSERWLTVSATDVLTAG